MSRTRQFSRIWQRSEEGWRKNVPCWSSLYDELVTSADIKGEETIRLTLAPKELKELALGNGRVLF